LVSVGGPRGIELTLLNMVGWRDVQTIYFGIQIQPEILKLSPSPTIVETIFKMQSSSPNKVQKTHKIHVFNNENAENLFH